MISMSYKMPKAGFENARPPANAGYSAGHRTLLELSVPFISSILDEYSKVYTSIRILEYREIIDKIDRSLSVRNYSSILF